MQCSIIGCQINKCCYLWRVGTHLLIDRIHFRRPGVFLSHSNCMRKYRVPLRCSSVLMKLDTQICMFCCIIWQHKLEEMLPLTLHPVCINRSSELAISVNTYRLDNWSSIPSRSRDYSFLCCVQTGSGIRPDSIQWVEGTFSGG